MSPSLRSTTPKIKKVEFKQKSLKDIRKSISGLSQNLQQDACLQIS